MAIIFNLYDAAAERVLPPSEPNEPLPADAGACGALGPIASSVHVEAPGQMIDAGSPDHALFEEIEAALRATQAVAPRAQLPEGAINAGAASV